jgi:hypothetical protein
MTVALVDVAAAVLGALSMLAREGYFRRFITGVQMVEIKQDKPALQYTKLLSIGGTARGVENTFCVQ